MLVAMVIIAVTALVIGLSMHHKQTAFLLRFAGTMIVGGSIAIVLNLRESQLDSEMLNYLVLVIGLGIISACLSYWIKKQSNQT